jgi:hypothetical protein
VTPEAGGFPPPVDLPGSVLRTALLALLGSVGDRLRAWGDAALGLEAGGVPLIGLALGLLALLLILRAVVRRRQSHAPAAHTGSGAGPAASADLEQVPLSACKAHDAVAAHRALLAWLRLERRPARSAGTDPVLDAIQSVPLADAVADLRQHLYGAAPDGWRGTALAGAIKGELKARKRAAKPSRQARLAPLYPEAG